MARTSPTLTIRIDPELAAAFLAACQAKDMTASQVLRAAVRDFVTANPQSPLPFDNVRKRGKLKGVK